jgi:hypothetical protein
MALNSSMPFSLPSETRTRKLVLTLPVSRSAGLLAYRHLQSLSSKAILNLLLRDLNFCVFFLVSVELGWRGASFFGVPFE